MIQSAVVIDRSAPRRAAALSAAWLAVLASSASACNVSALCVTNTLGSGPGSLSQAVADANANAGLDTIEFSIDAGTDAGCTGTPKICTIKPSASLTINSPVFIDGYSQSGASKNTLAIGENANLRIEIDGTGLNPVINLQGFPGVGASGSTISGLIISNVGLNGICVSCSFGVNTSEVTITGNYLGTDRSGTTVTAGGTAISSETSTGLVIGGPLPGDRNVIATTSTAIEFNQSSNGVVQGNYIGVDATGTAALSAFYGISLIQGASGNQIGGSAPGAGNVIAGASFAGIRIQGSGSGNNIVEGNFIGTDATGTVALGGAYGIIIGSADGGNRIGGSGAGEGNVVSGNGNDGINVTEAPVGLLIQGNKIGTDVSGKLPIPNAWCGVHLSLQNLGTSGTIGGGTADAANVIAFNGTNGVGMDSIGSSAWSIVGNSIHSNGSLGISLNGRCNDGSSSPYHNDDGDGDSGPNGLQNYPVITTATISNAGTHAAVSGTLNSLVNAQFHLEFFANAKCDGSNPDAIDGSHHGEGEAFLGSADIATSGHDGGFGILDLGVPLHRHVITATATAPDGSTSEFSGCSSQDTIFTDGVEGD